MAGPGLKELGGSGTPIYGGVIYDEYLSELTGLQGLLLYDKMRRSDSRIAGTLKMLKLPILQAKWTVNPSDDDDELGEEIALFVDRVLFGGMSYTWSNTLAQALLMLDFGFIGLEKCWELRDRPAALKDTKAPSKVIWLRKLAPRLPTTIVKWELDKNGSLTGVEQALPDGTRITIPVEKLVIVTNDKEGDNWEGRSILRSAYKHWYLKDHLEKIDAIGHERTALGVPVWDLNATETDLNSTEGLKLIQRCEDIAKALQAHEEQYVIETSGAKFRFEIVNRTNSSLLESIKHHEMCLAANVLSEFMMLGVTGSGSRAVAKEQRGPFELALLSIAANVSECLEQYVVQPLVQMNYGDRPGYPTLEAKGIQDADLKPLAEMVATLVEKAVITADPDLEDYLRRVLELPSLDRDEMERIRAEKEAAEKEKAAEELAKLKLLSPGGPEEPEGPEGVPSEKPTGGTPVEVPEERNKPTPGQPGAKVVKASTVPFRFGSPPETKRTWWRAPTDAEKYVDFEAIANGLDDARATFKAQVKYLIKPLTDDVAYSLAAEVVSGTVKPSPSKPPAQLTKTIRNLLLNVAVAGKRSVYDEKRRALAGVPVKRRSMLIREAFAEVVVSDPMQEWLTATADHAAQSIWRAAESAGTNRALHDIKVLHHDDEENELAALIDVIDGAVDKSTAAEAVAVMESFSAGRGEGITEQVADGDIAYGIYSALLDERTCNACFDRDGEEYLVGSPEFEQFYDGNSEECSGEDWCRCMLALTYRDEQRPEIGGPMWGKFPPETPEPSLLPVAPPDYESLDYYQALGSRLADELGETAALTGGDWRLGVLYRDAGFDGLPTKLSETAFDALEGSDTYVHVFRGVSSVEYAEDFISGPYYPGTGIFGNGSYGAIAEHDGLFMARHYAEEGDGVVRMLLRKEGAKIGDVDELSSQQYRIWKEFQGVRAAETGRLQMQGLAHSPEWNAFQRAADATEVVLSDIGRFATAARYDGYFCNNGQYFVLLNRSKAVVDELPFTRLREILRELEPHLSDFDSRLKTTVKDLLDKQLASKELARGIPLDATARREATTRAMALLPQTKQEVKELISGVLEDWGLSMARSVAQDPAALKAWAASHFMPQLFDILTGM